MNDRYLFRSKGDKRYNDGSWYEGYLIKDGDGDYQIYEKCTYRTVMKEAICQYTGLKNFFEKDIVKRTDLHKVGEPSIGIIEYDVENASFLIHWIDNEKYSPMYPWKDKIKVIGNVIDNPELVEWR